MKVLSCVILLSVILWLLMYIGKRIKKEGFNCINVFILIYTTFYIVTPLVFIIFEGKRDTSTLYNIALGSISNENILFNCIICIILLGFLIFMYNQYKPKTRSKKKLDINNIQKDNIKIYKKLNLIADLLFIIGSISIIIIIISVGGIKSYLALGSATRGAVSRATEFISSEALPLITLSQIILVSPYIYFYLMKTDNKKIIKYKLIGSLFFAILYLFYNQGRAPLILFLIPFLLVSKFIKRTKLIGLIILFILCFPLLEYLNGIFLYLSYGVYRTESRDIISTFLLEYSYPFSNFALKNELVNINGFRMGIDYILWIINIIPSSILKFVGIYKGNYQLVGNINTNSYSVITGYAVSGGIPVDFLTFNYYQGGYIILIFSIVIVALLLKKVDSYFYILKENLAFKIILYRVSISIINIMTNSDLSVIVRTRMDILILLFIIIYMGKKYSLRVINVDKGKKYEKDIT